MSNQTFGVNRTTGYVNAQTERITMNDDGTLANADERLDFSAWDNLDPVSEAIYTDEVKTNRPTGWDRASTTVVASALNGLNKG